MPRQFLTAMRGLAPGVSVMQTSQACTGHQRRVWRRSLLDGSAVWRVLDETMMNPIVMKVQDLATQKVPGVFFVQCNDVAQDFSPASGRSIFPLYHSARATVSMAPFSERHHY